MRGILKLILDMYINTYKLTEEVINEYMNDDLRCISTHIISMYIETSKLTEEGMNESNERTNKTV